MVRGLIEAERFGAATGTVGMCVTGTRMEVRWTSIRVCGA